MLKFALITALVGALPGCGLLIDEDIADFDLSIPPKEFVIDTETWEIQITDATFPAVDCANMPGFCSANAGMFCTGANCFASCGEGDNCEVLVQVDLWTTVNLAVEKPELSTINEQPIVSVSINRIWLNVLENTMNVDAPQLIVYVAPSNVMSSGSAEARMIGTIPDIKAGQTSMNGDLILTTDGKDHLKMFMKDYMTPFNLIVGGTQTVKAGDPIPMGLIRAEVNVQATAGL